MQQRVHDLLILNRLSIKFKSGNNIHNFVWCQITNDEEQKNGIVGFD